MRTDDRSFFLVEDTFLRKVPLGYLTEHDLEVIVRALNIYNVFIHDDWKYEDIQNSPRAEALYEKLNLILKRRK